MEINNHIVMRNGHACIARRGHMKAKMVARMYLWEKATIEEVMEQYELTAAEVHAAIAFYYDNQEELDAEYAESMELLKEVGTSLEEFKAKIAARQQQSQSE